MSYRTEDLLLDVVLQAPPIMFLLRRQIIVWSRITLQLYFVMFALQGLEEAGGQRFQTFRVFECFIEILSSLSAPMLRIINH